jgi:hypothetical protein
MSLSMLVGVSWVLLELEAVGSSPRAYVRAVRMGPSAKAFQDVFRALSVNFGGLRGSPAGQHAVRSIMKGQKPIATDTVL